MMVGIYKITNLINGKVYIGQSIKIKERWKQHIAEAKGSRNNNHLYTAMRKYGIENFSFEIIEECEIEQLNEREVYWIAQYDSFNREKGYNMTPGGSMPTGLPMEKIVEIYKMWDDGYTVGEIVECFSTEVCSATIRSYLHSYENYDKTESRKRSGRKAKREESNKNKNNKSNKILNNTVLKQYTLQGIFVKNWLSLREVERQLNISHNSISSVIKGEFLQTGGFQWRWGNIEDNSSIPSIIDKIPLHFEVIQKDKQGNFIARYKTIKEAAEAVNTSPSNISRVCQKKKNRKTAKGFIWEYDYNTWYDPD